MYIQSEAAKGKTELVELGFFKRDGLMYKSWVPVGEIRLSFLSSAGEVFYILHTLFLLQVTSGRRRLCGYLIASTGQFYFVRLLTTVRAVRNARSVPGDEFQGPQ